MHVRDTLETTLSAGNCLVAFVTAGDPSLDDLPSIVSAIVEGGADVVEIGLPFSDPIADGPVIQASSQRALDRGVTTPDIIEAISRIDVPAPLVVMGYTNTAMQFGFDEFAAEARRAGVSGVILSDLIPEESEDWIAAAKAAHLDLVFLAAPTSTDERLRRIAAAASGFIYCVSRTGVTGSEIGDYARTREFVARMRNFTELPLCVGFGISTPEQVRSVLEIADGAVVGSYLVDLIAREWQRRSGREMLVSCVRQLKAAL
jgi:tryptophan synthase alpha chain